MRKNNSLKNIQQKEKKSEEIQIRKSKTNEDTNLKDQFKRIKKQSLLKMNSEIQLKQLNDAYNKIIMNPEQNIRELELMFILLKVNNIKVVSKVICVLSQIFTSIAPAEIIDVDSIKNRIQVTITKDQFQVLNFEKNLVQQYFRFLKIIKQLNNNLKIINFNNDIQLYHQFKQHICLCLGKCYITLWNFNNFKQLNSLFIKFIKYNHCKNIIRKILNSSNVAMLSIKPIIIRSIAKIIINTRFKNLPSDLIIILNSTEIDNRYLQKEQDRLQYKKKKLKKKLYKQQQFDQKQARSKYKDQQHQNKHTLQSKYKKKKEKIMQKIKVREEVNNQFAEGDAILNNREIVRHNSCILQQLFYVYFKILVGGNFRPIYLKDTLNGMLKFAHFINIDLIQSMIQHLHISAQSLRIKQISIGSFQMRAMLVFTAESIINGPLSVYGIDDLKITTTFYCLLLDIKRSKIEISNQLFRLISLTLEQMLLHHRQLSQQVVAALIREIIIILFKHQQIPKLYLLQLIRLTVSKYHKIARMFEIDNQGYGLDVYNGNAQKPQISNAINTSIFNDKNKDYNLLVNNLINKLIRQDYTRWENNQKLSTLLQNDLNIANYL